MINGAHVIIYSKDAEADKTFIKDVLGFKYVDAHKGWLIFKLPPAEVAVHPSDENDLHEFYLMTDDLDAEIKHSSAPASAVRPWRSRAGVVRRASNCPAVVRWACTSRVMSGPERSSTP